MKNNLKIKAQSFLSLGKLVLILTCVFFSFTASAQNWQLVWSDEFNGSIGPDWVFEIGNGAGGWGNNELQYYRQQNASIQNGMLVITARQENFGGFGYTSARMKTQGRRSFGYGRIEARISAPQGSGLWPAFWMLGNNITSVGWPACGEIDIMEHVNNEGAMHGTIHWQDHNGLYANYGGSFNTNVSNFHVYAVERDANEIRWYVDGNLYHVADISGNVNGTGEFHNNFFILLNLAVGGNWPGFNIDHGALPAQMRVDWVRAYVPGTGGGNFVRLENKAHGLWLQGTHFADGTGEGNNVQSVPTHWTGDKTRWTLVPVAGDPGYFRIENRFYNNWLQATTITDATVGQPNPTGDAEAWAVRARDKSFTGDFTRWRKINTGDGYFHLQNKATGYYLQTSPVTDVDGNGFDGGQQTRLVPSYKTGGWTRFREVGA